MPRISRAQSKAATRSKLLQSAAKVFEQQGFNAAAVEDIAERAGFTRGAFYANFTDKADALLTLLEDDRGRAMDEIAALLTDTPDDQKLAALQAWYDTLVGDQRLARAANELIAQPKHNAAVRRRLAQRQANARAVIASMLTAYRQAEGLELPLSDHDIASLILAIGDGIANQRHLEPSAVTDDAFTTAVAYLWFGLLAGQT
ncbi:MAG: TetR/AcrR family transcriptional regulator [Microthrixaceae bacterium]